MAEAAAAPCLIAVLLGFVASLALGTAAVAQEKVGVDSAVNPHAEGTPPRAPTRRIELGQDIIHEERIVTGTDGQTQILFLDQSALTVGPNSDMTIDSFVYDPNSQCHGRWADLVDQQHLTRRRQEDVVAGAAFDAFDVHAQSPARPVMEPASTRSASTRSMAGAPPRSLRVLLQVDDDGRDLFDAER